MGGVTRVLGRMTLPRDTTGTFEPLSA
jgi:hypothetical protein